MQLHILTFGIARDIVGSASIRLEVDTTTITASQLKQQLSREYPELNNLASYMLAINSNFAADNDPVSEGDEVAIIPPVSGG